MNHYFHFKHFTIQQEKCAMKVSEIACIQGAWAAIKPAAKRVLDIGCGTGLLSLMLAQKYPLMKIDAIEIDEACFLQAKENITSSKFKNQICCINEDVLEYYPTNSYDFIIVNPPFFENDLKSKSDQKNIAWHSDALPLAQLIAAVDRLLNDEGAFCVLIPTGRKNKLFELTSEKGFFAKHILSIKHSITHPIAYEIIIFCKAKTNATNELLIIREEKNYTTKFAALMKDYYIKL